MRCQRTARKDREERPGPAQTDDREDGKDGLGDHDPRDRSHRAGARRWVAPGPLRLAEGTALMGGRPPRRSRGRRAQVAPGTGLEAPAPSEPNSPEGAAMVAVAKTSGGTGEEMSRC